MRELIKDGTWFIASFRKFLLRNLFEDILKDSLSFGVMYSILSGVILEIAVAQHRLPIDSAVVVCVDRLVWLWPIFLWLGGFL